MLSSTLHHGLNEQIKHELYSAYAYLGLSAYCEAHNLPGCAHWLKVQAEEELGHAMKFYQFILDRGSEVTLQAIDQPPNEFTSVVDVFQAAQAGERRVTSLIDNLYALAVQERDYASQVFLAWFVEEQVEEEKIVGQVVETLKLVGDAMPALLMFDRELGQRAKEA
jgi:ferritin